MLDVCSRSRMRCSCALFCIASSLLLLLWPAHAASSFLFKASAASAVAADQQTFSLDGVQKFTLIFRVKQLPQAPTPPAPYANMPMWRWEYTGGEGYLLVTRNDFGPLIGVLSEMMYFPGRFRPRCTPPCNTTFFSAQRFWVDMKISQQIGRTYWGFPKEMAAFEWTSDSVTAKDLSGNVFFHASLAAAEQTQPLPVWLNMYVRNGFHTLQWPIKDASITIGDLLSVGVRVAKTPEIAAEAAAEAKVAASLLHGTLAGATGAAVVSEGVDGPSNLAVLVPNRQTLSFPNYESLVLAKATAVWFDSFKFTGRENMTVALAEPADIGYLKGVPGQLNDPALFTCKQLLN